MFSLYMRVDLNSLNPQTALEGKTWAIKKLLCGYLRELALYACQGPVA